MMSTERSKELVATLQQAKAPLAAQREHVAEQLKAIAAEYAEKEKDFRDEMKSLNAQLQRYDELLSSANSLKTLKGEVAAAVETAIVNAIQELK